MDGSTACTCMYELWCGALYCMQKISDSLLKKTIHATGFFYLADKWSAAKCAAWKIASMSLLDGSGSPAYKRKLNDSE